MFSVFPDPNAFILWVGLVESDLALTQVDETP
jgi:hypothetical protein